MEFQYFTDQEPSKYQFAFHKKSTYKKKTLLNVDSHGSISFLRREKKNKKKPYNIVSYSKIYPEKCSISPTIYSCKKGL